MGKQNQLTFFGPRAQSEPAVQALEIVRIIVAILIFAWAYRPATKA